MIFSLKFQANQYNDTWVEVNSGIVNFFKRRLIEKYTEYSENNMEDQASVNKTIIIGKLNKEPIIGVTNHLKKDVANLLIITDDSFVNTAGENITRNEFHRIVVWGSKNVEICKNLQMGDKVYIEGRNQSRKFIKDEDEKPTYITEIVAQVIKKIA